MKSLFLHRSGFTVVELLIVIIVIGILAGLALNTLGSSQSRARDTERVTDIRAIHKNLEAFHTDNGYYPEVSTISASDFPGLNSESFNDPVGRVVNGTDADYSYASSSCVPDSHCTNYTLSAEMENATSYVISSLSAN